MSVLDQAQTLRKAIESLMDTKLHDALAKPGGLHRLAAHRSSGVASYDIRMAERRLEQVLAELIASAAAPENFTNEPA